MRRSEDNFRVQVCLFHHVGSRDQTQATRMAATDSPLSHLLKFLIIAFYLFCVCILGANAHVPWHSVEIEEQLGEVSSLRLSCGAWRLKSGLQAHLPSEPSIVWGMFKWTTQYILYIHPMTIPAPASATQMPAHRGTLLVWPSSHGLVFPFAELYMNRIGENVSTQCGFCCCPCVSVSPGSLESAAPLSFASQLCAAL